MKNKNLANTINELHRLFDFLNKNLFNGKLPKVILTVQSKGKTNALGWFTVGKVWEHGERKKHEINISAESLKQGYMTVADTLLHEMIHLYCSENDIKDTSRGGTYHNKRFKQASEEHGLCYREDSYSDKYGWTFTILSEQTRELLNDFEIDGEIFALNRIDTFCGMEHIGKKKSNIIKWECGCGVIIRSSKDDITVFCGECGTQFEKSKNED